ncbi:C40 family peptidase [Flavobacterium sp. xlx-214]|uniref:C40 family peptidase n=1 Tax=unclassified Flavobacterium TaxID=196869 RepID=UPI0013D2D584|nr:MULTISPECIES: C40 family peptidase [unclassified Flavobacterium]MBA5791213.1 C40 family peptidase [Flavobacterium sp. xlx-221]QMI83619.1 C40 family peptidase [Flavobacterium sp. xlx-214]
MKNLALTLVAFCTICLSTEVSAQTKISVTKTSAINKQRIAENLAIAEINKKMNAVDDELEGKTSKKSEKAKYCYLTEQLMNVASDYQGIRYQWGGMSRNGMDCSGFVKTAFNQFKIDLPRTSKEMASRGERVSASEAKPGDLIFFKNGGSRVINHVGIVIEVNGDDIKFIHSATSKGVSINSTKEAYYSRGFVQINRVYDRQVL